MSKLGVTAPKGFFADGVHCGIRKNQVKRDLAVVYSEVLCNASSVYTQNKVVGAPIIVTKDNLNDGTAQLMICNSGNANTCNKDGVFIATEMCKAAAEKFGVKQKDVIVASTGVIGAPLDIEKIKSGILKIELKDDGGNFASEAIMTTDLITKQAVETFEIDGKICTIGAMAKGSGMINPNMATMLGFVTTDVNISSKLLDKALKQSVNDTYNMICVDGDTSTNDMVSIMANGLAGNSEIESEDENYNIFLEKLTKINMQMAKLIAKDGEGATKLIKVEVLNTRSEKDAKSIAKSVCSSSLVKTAIFGEDANWGRVLCAIGYADACFDVYKINVWFESKNGNIQVCEDGYGLNFDESKAVIVLSSDEITIKIDMNDGEGYSVAYGCDLTYDYVKINGDYRT